MSTARQILTFRLAPSGPTSASCEGSTETGLDALGRDLPYLQSVACGYRPAPRRGGKWTSTPGLERPFGGPGGARVRPDRHRARAATRAGGRSLSGVEFRQRLGYGRVRSLALRRLADARRGRRLTGHGLGRRGSVPVGARRWPTPAQDSPGHPRPLLPGDRAPDPVLTVLGRSIAASELAASGPIFSSSTSSGSGPDSRTASWKARRSKPRAEPAVGLVAHPADGDLPHLVPQRLARVGGSDRSPAQPTAFLPIVVRA